MYKNDKNLLRNNYVIVFQASPEIKKVEVAATDEGIEEVPLRDNYHGYKPVRGTKKEIEDELEDLKIEEPTKPVEKPKKKKRKPKPEKEPEPPVPVMAAESTNDLGKLFEISNEGFILDGRKSTENMPIFLS